VATAGPGGLERVTDVAGDGPAEDERSRGAGRGPASADVDAATPTRAAHAGRRVHRLRDLGPGERWVAAALGVGLLLAPIAAFVVFAGDWVPAGDPAHMALRTLDVGTSRTPLIGQPSSSHVYSGDAPAHHPGPVHFYLMALPVRVLGGATGMLLVSVLITGTALLASAWAVFRQLGRTAGVLAAVLLAAIAFTTGAASLVNPVSSNIAGYPLLLAAVLLWCVACGDIELLPLTAAAVSFTAQQHLSVGVAIATITVGSLALLAALAVRERWWREPETWRRVRRNALVAGLVALVLWAPVLLQQVVGDAGNLGQIVTFAQEGNRETLGGRRGLWQLVHALALPPLLGRTDVSGVTFLKRPDLAQWVSAVAVIGFVGWLGWRWRSSRPRQARLCAMAGLVAVAGYLTGSSIPFGLEQGRLAFYHWAWPLTLFVGLALGLAAVGAVRRLVPAPTGWVRGTIALAAVVAVVAPVVANPQLTRPGNEISETHTRIERGVVDDIVGQVMAHDDSVEGPTLLFARNEPLFAGMSQAIAFGLVEEGVDVRFPRYFRDAVHEDRLADRAALDGALLVVFGDDQARPVPATGELIAEYVYDQVPGEAEAFDSLVAIAEAADEVRFAPEQERALDDAFTAEERRVAEQVLDTVLDDPEESLRGQLTLEILRDFPPVEPAFDPDDVATVAASEEYDVRLGVDEIRVYALDRDQTLDIAAASEVGKAGDGR
jgi:hypothetical protein